MTTSPFKKLFQERDSEEPVTPKPDQLPNTKEEISEPKKRGRPATGKRSDPDWIGRTFYIQRSTDLDVEGELLQLKRQGIEIDKSELVDHLLSAWAKWQNGENIEIQLSEFSPRRKG